MKKGIVGGVIVGALVLGIGLSGCTFISTNSESNLTQSIADVNITLAEDFEDCDLVDYQDAIADSEILKRDLIAYFLNAGYSYVQSGMSYRNVFTTLVDSLTQTEILVQYATMYLLDFIVVNSNYSLSDVIDDYSTYKATDYSYFELDEDSSVHQNIYLLKTVNSILADKEADGTYYFEEYELPDRVMLATYDLFYSLNASLDSYETALFEDEDNSVGSGSRTTPDNVDTEYENYYPVAEDGTLDYGVYTGYGEYVIANSGVYRDDRLENSTRTTRRSAYNSFIQTLKSNYLLEDDEDYTDILSLDYIQIEISNNIKQQVVNLFYQVYELEREETISTDEYLQEKYDDMLSTQMIDYANQSSFGSALGSMADDSFVLYAPNTNTTGGGSYGFVYNILLPFSEGQNINLGNLQQDLSNDIIDYNKYYSERNKMLSEITTTDQRGPWFNGTTDYSFKASKMGSAGVDYYVPGSSKILNDSSNTNAGVSTEKYLFFENNMLKTKRYETLEKYTGRYAYNGDVYYADDDSYILFPQKLTIDDMLDEFAGYIDFVLNGEVSEEEWSSVQITKVEDYFEVGDFTNEDYKTSNPDPDTAKKITEDDIDYSKLIYAYGKIDVNGNKSCDTNDFYMGDLMNPETNYYKVMSAVNELQYAYTTDTGVLSQYAGYTVDAGDTSYIKEFETASHIAMYGGQIGSTTIDGGVGTFVVCAGDYGWHLIYVTAVYDNELKDDEGNLTNDVKGYEVYKISDNWSRKNDEGTFENLFYTYIKDIEISGLTDALQQEIVSRFCDDDSIVLHEKTYKDLLNMG